MLQCNVYTLAYNANTKLKNKSGWGVDVKTIEDDQKIVLGYLKYLWRFFARKGLPPPMQAKMNKVYKQRMQCSQKFFLRAPVSTEIAYVAFGHLKTVAMSNCLKRKRCAEQIQTISGRSLVLMCSTQLLKAKRSAFKWLRLVAQPACNWPAQEGHQVKWCVFSTPAKKVVSSHAFCQRCSQLNFLSNWARASKKV